MEILDLSTKADAAVAIRLIAYVDDAGSTAAFFACFSGDFSGHAQGSLDGSADLQGRGRGEKEAAPGDVEGLGKMFGLIGSDAYGPEAQGRPCVEAGDLAAFCGGFHIVHPSMRPERRAKLEGEVHSA